MSVAGEGFGQKRPPLYHLIKNILREYPSGQVFKVRSINVGVAAHASPSADIIVDLVSVNRHGGLSGSGSVVVSILV